MKNRYFIPFFKTKPTVEIPALNECLPLLNDFAIIPYIEITKDNLSHSTVTKIKKMCKDIIHFEEFDYVNNPSTPFTDDNIIYAIKINGQNVSSLIDIFNTASLIHSFGKRISIRLNDGFDKKSFLQIVSALNADDFIFIDMEGNDVGSSLFVRWVSKQLYAPSTVILSEERPQRKTGKEHAKNGFNTGIKESHPYNTSLIQSIKEGTYPFAGFATYCGLKNTLTDTGNIAREIYGVFSFYEYKQNQFYSLRSDTQAHITIIYDEVSRKVRDNYNTLYKDYFKKTPISEKMLSNYLSNHPKNKHSRCVDFMTFSMVHYIEEINNNLLKVF